MNDNNHEDVSKTKDRWDKVNIILRPVGGLLTGLSIAVVGFVGTAALDKKQTKETNLRLYSELMTKREEAESKLRTEMFNQIFTTFLTTGSDQLDGKLLRLELITRNFHDFIDIKPLFVHVVRLIADEMWKCYKEAPDACEPYKHQLWRLLRIAKRIKTKQVAVLGGVGDKCERDIRITKNVCVRYNIDTLKPFDVDGYAPIHEQLGEKCKPIELWLDKEKKMIGRKFAISAKYAYPKWQMIHLQVKAKPIGEKSIKRAYKEDIKRYWVGHFDFPVVDNTYLSPEERYAVVLDEYDDKKNIFKLKIIYFPATYAGMKEKTFYHQKVLDHLTRKTEFLADVQFE